MFRLKKSGVYKNHKIGSEQLVIFAYCIFVLVNVLNTTQFKNVIGWSYITVGVKYFCLLLVSCPFLLGNTLKKNTVLLYAILAIIGVVVALSGGRKSEIVLVLVFFATGHEVKSDKFLKSYFVVVLCAVLFTLLLYVVGIYEYDVAIGGGRSRLYTGFTYTTYLPNYFFHLILVYFVIKKKNIGIKDTVMIAILNRIIYQLTDTKAVYFEIYLLLLLLWGLRIAPTIYKSRFFKIGTLALMPVLATLSIWLSYIYTTANYALLFLNKLLNTRLSLGHLALERYGLTWFGSETAWVTGRYGIERTEAYFYVDSSYLNIALSFGMVTLVLVVTGFFILNRKALAEHQYVLCVVLIMLAIHSFSDPQLFDLKYNPFIILAGSAFLRKEALPIGNAMGV
jgi:hypothetical protein